jgi:putative drug exporter of the RND superfamily
LTPHHPGPCSKEPSARALVAGRIPIVLAWLALATGLTLWLPSIDEAQLGALGDLVPADSEAIETEERARELFSLPLLSRTLVVARDDDGIAPGPRRRALRFLAGLNLRERPPFEDVLAAVPLSNRGGMVDSGEVGTAVMAYLFLSPDLGQTGQMNLARLVANELEARMPGSEGQVSGAIAAREARGTLIREHLPLVEAVTLVVVVVLTALAFRSLIVPLVGLLAVAVSYLVAVRILSQVGHWADVSVPREVEPVIVALIFGVVTDYLIFQAARYRHYLQEGVSVRDACARGTADVGPVIAAAGAMVAAAALALLVADVGFMRAFGPGVAVAVVVAVAVALTLIPALFALFGRALFWPRGLAGTPGDRSRLPRLAANRPVAVAAATTAGLVLCATGLFHLRTGNDLFAALPPTSEPRQGFEAAAHAFAPGIVGPTTVLVEAPGLSNTALKRFGRVLEQNRRVAGVVGAANLPPDFEDGVFRTADAARFIVVLEDTPLGSGAIRALDRIRASSPEILRRAGLAGANVSFGGDTALSAEVVAGTTDSLFHVAPVALAAVYALLVLLLRRWVIPLLLLFAGALSVAAALGLTAYVFLEVLGQGELTFFVPFAAAVLLLALGCDYSALIAKQINDEAARRPLREAVVEGGARATTAISAAGVILALSFAALFLIPVRSFDQFAFTMTAGLLIDTFLVRSLLIPSLIALEGDIRQRAAPAGLPASSPDARDRP